MGDSIRQRVRWAAITLICGVLAIIAAVPLTEVLFLSSPLPSVWLWISGSLALLLFLVGSYRLSRFADAMSAAVREMTVVAGEIARGDLERKIRGDEIPIVELRELADAINAMATRAKSDISEMKRLERVRSEFLGNVSHELRTPIFSVQGFLETLIDGAVEDETVRDDFLQKAHQNALRLHALLTDLIEISRIESGEMKMSFRYFNAVDYLRVIIEELRPSAEIAGIELDLNVIATGDGEISILGDRDRLKQVVVNLVENAIKYNRPNGRVIVELESDEKKATIRVRDTGIGIPDEDIGRIFERFYRVNKDRSRAVGGSGLGLAIVKHIIEAHGTSITVTSEHGVGSMFSFDLKRSV